MNMKKILVSLVAGAVMTTAFAISAMATAEITVTNSAEFLEAVSATGTADTIILGNDIVLDAPASSNDPGARIIEIPCTINLNDNTLDLSNIQYLATWVDATIKNGTITVKNTNSGILSVYRDNLEFTLDDVVIEQKEGYNIDNCTYLIQIHNKDCIVNINDCDISAETGYGLVVANNTSGAKINITDSVLETNSKSALFGGEYVITNSEITANQYPIRNADGTTKIIDSEIIGLAENSAITTRNDGKVYTIGDSVVNVADSAAKKAVAKIGETFYETLQEAFNAASGKTVTLCSDIVITTADKLNWNGDTYYSIGVKGTVTLDLAGHKIIGNAGSDTNHYALFCYQAKAPNVFTITDSVATLTADVDSIAGGAIVNDPVLTKSGKFSNVLYNNGSVVIDGGTLYNAGTKNGNLAYAIESVTVGTTGLTINDGAVISEDSIAVRVLSQGSNGTQTAVINGGEIVGGVDVILKQGGADVINFTMTNGEIDGYLRVRIYNTPAEGATADTIAVSGGTITGEFIEIGNLDDTEITLDGSSFEMYDVNEVAVEFEDVTDADARGERVYNINLTVAEDKILNRLNSVDLTFNLEQISGENTYEVIESNNEISINNVNNLDDRYEFHYDGKTDVETDTAQVIIIGQIKVTGYGKYTLSVAEADTNAVHLTTLIDNIVTDFAPNGILDGKTVGVLDIDDSETFEIFAPTQKLTIKVAFPNNIENNVLTYQKMNVLVTGEDITDISIDLGTDNLEEVALTLTNKNDASYDVDYDEANSVYTIVITNALTANTAYNVTVSGAGYRTARYTVNTQETDKILNFWNNVKDNAIEVEEGKDTSKKNITFLAGDIVKDSNINIYDLSAVVSYFGEIMGVNAEHAYAKYDLNRDGKIDSKDVAYVLVSWNN